MHFHPLEKKIYEKKNKKNLTPHTHTQHSVPFMKKSNYEKEEKNVYVKITIKQDDETSSKVCVFSVQEHFKLKLPINNKLGAKEPGKTR